MSVRVAIGDRVQWDEPERGVVVAAADDDHSAFTLAVFRHARFMGHLTLLQGVLLRPCPHPSARNGGWSTANGPPL